MKLRIVAMSVIIGSLASVAHSQTQPPKIPPGYEKPRAPTEAEKRAYDEARNTPLLNLCEGLANAVYSEYMADTGDGKGALLKAENPNCSSRDRWRKLSLRHRELNAAILSHDPQAIADAANRLAAQVNASSMFKSCWRTMVKHGKLIGDAYESALNLITGGACQAKPSGGERVFLFTEQSLQDLIKEERNTKK